MKEEFKTNNESTTKDFYYLINRFSKDILETLVKKGEDYNNGNNFSIFEQISKELNVSVEKVLMVFILTKTKRISNLLDKESSNFESIDDSILDLACYTTLLNAYINRK